MRILLLSLAVGLIACGSAFFAVNHANATTVVDPWNTQALTYNPAGVKWSGGMTRGHELEQGYVPSWQEPVRVTTLAELADLRARGEK